MLRFLRGKEPPRRNTATEQTQTYEDGRSIQTFFGPQEKYFLEHSIPDTKSMLNPSLHIHWFQTEEFNVKAGHGYWYHPSAPRPSDRILKRKGGDVINLPKGTYHHFCNASDDEPLVVSFEMDPRSKGINEEMFFRNFFGYLDDCRVQKISPSVFQLELFMWTGGTGMAIPIPGPNWVKYWTSMMCSIFLGVVIGEWVLGYRRTYPEYYCGHRTGEGSEHGTYSQPRK